MSSPEDENATPEAFRRTLVALDMHVRAAEAEIDDMYAEYGLTPSDNQWFVYPSTDLGVIQCQQDAAFVCEAIMVVGAANYTAFLSPSDDVPVTANLTLSIQQMSPQHRVTFSRGKAYNTGDNTILDSNGVTPEAFVPVATTPSVVPAFTNADYFYRLPVEWLIPRGDVVQTFFADRSLLGVRPFYSALPHTTRYSATPHVLLLGYKVY